MKHINNREAYHLLYEAGFADEEISQLIQLRRDYTARKPDQAHPRLQLVWWVVQTLLDFGHLVCLVAIFRKQEA